MARPSKHIAERSNLTQNRPTNGPRWFQLWIASGLVLAVLLLVSSISTYVMVSRRLIVEHLRGDLASQVAMMDQQVQRGAIQNRNQLSAILQQTMERSSGRIAWIQIHDGGGEVVSQTGPVAKAAFSNQDIRSRIQSRQPIFKTVDTATGTMLVEVFPFRLPGAVTPADSQAASSPVRPAHRFSTVEIAAGLEGAGTSLWPLRRNLMINSSAALMLLISLAVVALRLRSYVAGQQLEQEIEIARSVQQDLLAARPDLDGFDVATDCVPAARVGGDFYDAFPVSASRDAFVLGDVSGKGVPAALLMGVIHGAVRSSTWTESRDDHQEATRQMNRLLYERAATSRFATMFWSYFDPGSQHLKYINAGHCPPLLVKAARRNTILRLSSGGPALGLLAGAEYQQGSVRLDAGDVLVLYSDGIVEATNSADEEFGEDRVLAILSAHCKETAEEICSHILASVDAFTGRMAPRDDRTLVVVVYQGGAQRTGGHESQRHRIAACAA